MDTPSGANAVSRRKGYAHFPTKSGLMGGTKQCIVQKNGFTSCKTAANALFYSYSLPLYHGKMVNREGSGTQNVPHGRKKI